MNFQNQNTTSEKLVGLHVEEVTSGITYKITQEDGFSVKLEPQRDNETVTLKWVSVDLLGKQYQLEPLDFASASSEVQELFQ